MGQRTGFKVSPQLLAWEIQIAVRMQLNSHTMYRNGAILNQTTDQLNFQC